MHASCLLPMLVILSSSLLVADVDLDTSSAIREIELLGGKVSRNETLPDRPVIEVDLAGSIHLNDRDLHLLRVFEQMTKLNLTNTRITDEGANEIGKLTSLTSLSLAETAITDGGLKPLRHLKFLTTLKLNETQITDRGLMELGELKNLNLLVLGKTQGTGSGEKNLIKALPNLRIRRISRLAFQEIEEKNKRRVQRMFLINDK